VVATLEAGGVMITRRTFLRVGVVAGTGLVVLPRLDMSRALAAQSPQVLLPGDAIPQFVDPLPGLDVIAGTDQIELHMREFLANVMPSTFVPATGTYAGTWVWGYLKPDQTGRSTYLGPVIVAVRGTPTEVRWVNDLGSAADTNVLGYRYSPTRRCTGPTRSTAARTPAPTRPGPGDTRVRQRLRAELRRSRPRGRASARRGGVNGPPMWVIGTDGGYLDRPVKIDPNAPKGQPQRLLMMPGERYDVIIDFNDPTWLALNPNFSGTLRLQNVAKTPFPGGTAPNGGTVGRIMQFVVGAAPAGGDGSYNPASGIPLRSGGQVIVRLPGSPGGPAIVTAAGATQNVQKVRQLTLNEVIAPPKTAINPVTGVLTNYPVGPLEVLVNNTKWDGMSVDTTTFPGGVRPDFTAMTVGGVTEFVSELSSEGDTEIWEIVNLTADAHPIHLHLVQFQVVSRQSFNTSRYNGVYNAAFPGGLYVGGFGPPLDYQTGNPRALGGNPDITPYLQGAASPPSPQEAGWKDTVITYPGQVTRIAARFAPTDKALDASDLYYPFDPDAGGHGFVFHCHIIDHEDNEMMRPDRVVPDSTATRTYVQGVDY
jgi:FtsP/CotA-like multicopper oxidase with cupredoxin domain